MALPPDRRSDLQSGVQGSVRSRWPSALGVRTAPRLGAGEGPVHRPAPSSGAGDYFRFLLHRGLSQPPDPDLDRVWAIVPVTVSRASSAASGRCHPALTGVGAVPCDQSRAATAACPRRITPPPASAVSPPITARRARRRQPNSPTATARWLPAPRAGSPERAPARTSGARRCALTTCQRDRAGPIIAPYVRTTSSTWLVRAPRGPASGDPSRLCPGRHRCCAGPRRLPAARGRGCRRERGQRPARGDRPPAREAPEAHWPWWSPRRRVPWP
jgi:hypothetical protein